MNTANNSQINTFTSNRIAIAVVAASVLSLGSIPTASAKNHSSEYPNSSYDHAKVVDVQPIYETYQVNQPITQCWTERVAVEDGYHPSHRKKSRTPEIVGAIIGGVIGNQIGKNGGGRARDVATVAGAVLGGSIGRDVKHQNRRDRYRHDHYQNVRYENIERCEERDNYVSKSEVVAYEVAYKYRGNVYHTQMANDPGNKIRVKVTVDPV